MKFKDLYERGLDRKVNPAVSASDLSEETVHTEIEEYVFTQEIIVNLYNILTNIRLNQGSHVGIWINGYYGSGKSHFLKYASYCLSGKYSKKAFERLIDATQQMLLGDKDISALEIAGVSLSDLRDLQNWYENKADVEMVMFNIGDVHDANVDRANTFTTIFWNQFNAKRGYNSFNLPMAQYLEKALDDDGKFGEFKEYVKGKGYDWERNISRFAASKLDLALQMAKEVDPALAIDVIRERIKNNDINISVEAFAAEMKEYIDRKANRNLRILFFVDEVSQFIGEHRDLLLQLQSLVKRLDEVCESQVWISCTAQQTLEDVVKNVGGSDTNPDDEVGKILGRFEVRASLQGTSPEYITQKRILEKKGEVEIELQKLYEKNKAMLDAQFILPGTYQSYKNETDFAAFYPFVPYQFQLIMKVLDSFVNMNYVDKQVKGNERSLLNITFSIAKETAECEVGEFISFDRFFGAMFQGSMQHLGQRAMSNARQALDLIKDEKKQTFCRRVVYVLFMVCNLSDSDKQGFSATIDNIVTLLMTQMDANKAAIKEEVSQVLSFLMDKSVIRKVKKDASTEIYEFYTDTKSSTTISASLLPPARKLLQPVLSTWEAMWTEGTSFPTIPMWWLTFSLPQAPIRLTSLLSPTSPITWCSSSIRSLRTISASCENRQSARNVGARSNCSKTEPKRCTTKTSSPSSVICSTTARLSPAMRLFPNPYWVRPRTRNATRRLWNTTCKTYIKPISVCLIGKQCGVP